MQRGTLRAHIFHWSLNVRAVVWKEPRKVTVDQVDNPKIQEPGDAVVG